MHPFFLYVLLAIAATLPALVLRFGSWQPSALVAVGGYGSAILAAGFLLSWGAESAERFVSQGLILALVALVTVLPEYAVDIYYAFQAGQHPQSMYVHYAAANMTGANRLLVGVAWPLMAVLHWYKTRQRAIDLQPANGLEIGFLLGASLYAFIILLRDQIGLWDTLILVGLFGSYLWRVSHTPKAQEAEEDEEPGPAAALSRLPKAQQWGIIGLLTAVASGVILVCAEPFAESIVRAGRQVGIDEFLLIQWLAPLASEAPTVSIAVLFVLAGRSGAGLTAMISDKINQWTLLIGMLPLAMSVGASTFTALPLDTRQHEEFFLTATQSLFGVAVLLRFRLSLWHAAILVGLFSVQIGLAFHYQHDPVASVRALTYLGWVYLALALFFFTLNFSQLNAVARQVLRGSPATIPD
ncbi:sodium:proton exchanger [Spirosoma sp. 209]|uniref:sodium:proton exchanger n=1 Tax=Spirosoma sp. 209 TaxID=1955701 RepID=UPI00098D086A|nr:sodium:proton exchanger [Spirosoma sp. 209]